MTDDHTAQQNVYATPMYIVRRYSGVQTVRDMADINDATITEMGKFLELSKPVRILLDLRGKYKVSFEIYEEALKALNMNEIDRIAIIQPKSKFVGALSEHTRDTYQKFINYQQFTDMRTAGRWLSQS